ncbi:hypothetical protein ACK6D9_08295 [Hoeflea sp. Naph1]|uniref:hypothetical protein n=1 Tax=Hoeflea sp. Naph1 TaxID=3388653 RepID=UPI00398FD4BA
MMTNLNIDKDSNPGPNILCLSRESFIKDIYELRKRTNFSYSLVMAGFTRFQLAWFPKEMQIQTYYQRYVGLGNDRPIYHSTEYALNLIQMAGKEKKIEAVISANIDYWQDVGFKKACAILQIPFIVISREHPVIPRECDKVKEWYHDFGYIFTGSAIAVAGESSKKTLEDSNINFLNSKIVVTGLPRFDAWRDLDKLKPHRERTLITLLTFTKGYYADETFKNVLSAFCELADEFSNCPVRFLIKTKDLQDTVELEKFIGGNRAPNLMCSHETPLFSVLADTKVAIGYNSLSLVEAAIARAFIALPAWGECKSHGHDVMYSSDNPKVKAIATHLYKKEDLKNLISKHINCPPTTINEDAFDLFVNEFVHISKHKTNSESVSDLIEKCINES